MTIKSVHEIWNGRTGNHNAGNVRTYKRVFRVVTDSALNGPFQVGAIPTGIPALYASYQDAAGSIDLGARVHDYDVKQDEEDPDIWIVEVQYSSAFGHFRHSPRRSGRSGRSGTAEQAQKGQEDQNPLDRPTVIKVQCSRFQKPLRKDLSGSWVRNTNAIEFSPLPEIDDDRILITFDRNELILDMDKIKTYRNAVNSDPFFGFSAGLCKMSVSAQSAYDNGLYYFQYTYSVEARDEGWDVILINHGAQVSDGGNPPNLKNPVDNFGSVLADAPLNIDGTQRSPFLDPIELTFKAYNKVAYAPLGLV